jgi:hypothetical protein
MGMYFIYSQTAEKKHGYSQIKRERHGLIFKNLLGKFYEIEPIRVYKQVVLKYLF